MIIAIVTADKNWGIGKNGLQITTIPDDVRYIRAATSGQSVIMGRKTFEAIPHGQLQPGRTNIVLTRNEEFHSQEAVTVHSPQEALKAAPAGTDVFILGGAGTFEAMLPFVDEVQVTHVDYVYDTDVHFPNLSKLPEWVQTYKSEEMTHFDTIYYLEKYTRRKDYRG